MIEKKIGTVKVSNKLGDEFLLKSTYRSRKINFDTYSNNLSFEIAEINCNYDLV